MSDSNQGKHVKYKQDIFVSLSLSFWPQRDSQNLRSFPHLDNIIRIPGYMMDTEIYPVYFSLIILGGGGTVPFWVKYINKSTHKILFNKLM